MPGDEQRGADEMALMEAMGVRTVDDLACALAFLVSPAVVPLIEYYRLEIGQRHAIDLPELVDALVAADWSTRGV
jgi:hypothetical protein